MIKPLVSVLIVTYNHESFLSQCLQSAIDQKTSFALEIVIGEDCSTDRTKQIVKEFASLYPDVIKPIYHQKNVGMMPNLLFCLEQCRGKYVAFLDGDDYWTNAQKLQKQIDFLEVNDDYAICAHNVKILKNGVFEDPLFTIPTGGIFTINDLAQENFLFTASVVFRAGLIQKYPEWFVHSPVGDYVLHMLNAKKGKIKYLPDTMAVYRTHQGGTWWGQPMESVLKKWLTVLSLLQTEPFEQSVLNQLKITWQRTASEYIAFLIDNNKPELREQLLLLTDQNHDLKMEWFDILIDNTLQLKAISGNYNGLRNSRLRKGLSHVFKQLKMS